MFGRKRKEIKSLRAELEAYQINYNLRCQGERNAIKELTEVKQKLEICENKLKKYENEEPIYLDWEELKKNIRFITKK